jgi:hypothetical protein
VLDGVSSLITRRVSRALDEFIASFRAGVVASFRQGSRPWFVLDHHPDVL